MRKKIGVLLIGIVAILGISMINTNADNFTYQYYIENLPATIERSENFKVRGWVMSEYKNKEVNVYIDDLKVDTKTEKRPDVLNAIKGCGDEKSNPTPGYIGYIDTTQLSLGEHTYKIKIVDKDSKKELATITKSFELVSYKYTSWIERLNEPVEKTTKYKIRGWVMANTKDKEVKAYVDDQEIEIASEERPDVIEAITGYGGEELNPTPGYVGYIDTTKLTAGKHEFKLVITDTKTKEVIGKVTKDFTVEAYKYTYYMERVNSIVERDENYKIRGWVMSNAKNKEVKAYVDDQEITISSEKRPDVIEAITGYGGEELNPTPGYVGYIDTTKLTAGKHEFKLVITEQTTGELMGEETKEFEVESYNYTYYMEKINEVVKRDDKYQVRGWVMADTPNKEVKAYVDNQEIALSEEERPDVLEAIKGYGGESCNPTPGYIGYMDTSNLTTGKHEFKLVIIDTINNEIIGEETKKFEVEDYKYLSWVETPKVDSTVDKNIKIKGWVMTPVADKTIKVYIDDEEINVEHNSRPDVIEVYGEEYGDSSLNPYPGYEGTYDASNLKDGKHKLTIITINNNNQEIIRKETTTFNLKKYKGEIYLENFMSNPNNLFTKEIKIRGWKMTDAPGSYAKVYIDITDMEKLGTTITPEERSDVLDAYGDIYGVDNNKVPGFNINIDLSQVGQGRHTLKIVIYSNEDEEIYTYTREIVVYKNLTLGIDVSQHNGSIDWKKVKNDSIDFAFIRLGYRGWGTGINTADSQYRTNINNAYNAGIKVGVYFFSQAINEKEGREEADYVIDTLMPNGLMQKVTLPIAIDTETSTGNGAGRADNISVANRTAAMRGFVDRIKERGYNAIIYASTSWLENKLDMTKLSDAKVWLAHWTHDIEKRPTYKGLYEAWQYTDVGTVSGISKAVDRDVSFAMY